MQGDSNLRVDFRFAESGSEAVAASARSLNAELRTIQQHIADIAQSSGSAAAATIAALEREVGAIRQKGAALGLVVESTNRAATANDRLAESADRVAVAFTRVSAGTLAGITKELETQVQVTRELGAQASSYGSIQAAQLASVLAVRRAESDAMKASAAEELRVAQERQKFYGQVAPQSNVAERRRLDKDLFDSETAGFQRVAAAQAAATAAMLVNLRRYSAEEIRADHERQTFMDRISPQTRVRYEVSSSGELKAVDAGLAGIGANSAVASREARHLVGIFDEIKRGQFGAVFSSIGAGMRDAGVGTVALYSGIAALVGVGLAEGLHRMTVVQGELAEKTLIAASAAGVSVEQYSRLSGIMQMAGGSTATLDRALEITSRQLETAISDPTSRTRAGFSAMGLGRNDLEQMLTNPVAALEKLRQIFQSMPDDGRKTEAFVAALGREFRVFQPYLTSSTEQIRAFVEAVGRSGTVNTKEFEEALATAAKREHELDIATTGLKEHLAALVSDTGLTSWLTWEIEQLSKAADGWRAFGNAVEPVAAILGRISSITTMLPTNPMSWLPGGGVAGRIGEMFGGGAAAPASTSTMVAGGALTEDKALALIRQYESPEGNVRNFRYDKTHTASGYYQMTDTTWKEMAPQAGIDIGQFPTAMSAPYDAQTNAARLLYRQRGMAPWANFNPQLAAALQGGALGPGVQTSGQLVSGGVLGSPGQVIGSAGAPSQMGQLGGLKELNDALQRDVKAIQDQTKLQNAEYEKQIADAGHNKDQAEKIAQEKAQFEEQQAQKIVQRQQQYRDAAKGAGFAESEIDKYADPTQAQVGVITAQAQVSRAAQAAKDEHYRIAKEDADLQIAEAHRAAQAIIESATATTAQKIQAEENYKSQVSSIYSGLIAQSTTVYAQDARNAQQLAVQRVNAEREADAEIAKLRKQTIQDLEKEATRAEREMRVDTRAADVGIQAQKFQQQQSGGGGLFSGGMATYQREVNAAKQATAAIEAWETKAIAAAQAVIDAGAQGKASADQVADAELKIKEIRTQAAQEELQLIQKLQQSWSSVTSSMTSFFNQLGSTFESGLGNIVKAIIAPQVEIIHAGLTTIRETNRGQQMAAAVAQMLTSAIEGAAKMVGGAAMNAIGNMLLQGVAGKDVSEKLSNWLTGMFTGQAAPQASQLGTATLTQLSGGMQQLTVTMSAASTAQTAATTANTTLGTVTTANTVATTANTAGLTTSSGTSAAGSIAGGGLSGIGGLLSKIPLIGGLFGGASATAPAAASAASSAAANAPVVAAITAQTAAQTASAGSQIASTVASTATNTADMLTQTGAIVASQAAVGAEEAAAAMIPKPLGFAFGGIVPSAAGGMVVGGASGGIPAILHAREMVLPAHISEAVQGMAAGRGSGNEVSRTTHNATNVNYSPTINTGPANLSRSDFASLLSAHLPSVVGDLRTMMRQGWRP